MIKFIFCFDGFPYVFAPAFSTPAFSAPPTRHEQWWHINATSAAAYCVRIITSLTPRHKLTHPSYSTDTRHGQVHFKSVCAQNIARSMASTYSSRLLRKLKKESLGCMQEDARSNPGNVIIIIIIITALHGMQTRSSNENSVCPSVRPSVCQTPELWVNGRKISAVWKIIQPSFLIKRMVSGGHPFYLKFWVNGPTLERNRRFWTDNHS